MAARVLGQARRATWDALPVALALAHGALLLVWPSIPLVAVGLWWNANTISHHFIHRPFFQRRALNAAFSCYLSFVLGFPQSLWRARHLAHHSAIEGRRERHDLKVAPLDFGAVIALWGALLFLAPDFMLIVYMPGFLVGLGLCYLQGHYEHARGTVSHYGWLYNFLLFNDGYHIEHHARPAANWRELPRHRRTQADASRWPAVLRWLELLNLCALERIVLRFPALQRFVLERHERAFRTLLMELPPAGRIGIVGGGLFPRTALILRRLLPESKLVLIDQSAGNLAVAQSFLSWEGTWERRHPCLLRGTVATEQEGRQGCLRSQVRSQGSQEFVNERFEPGTSCDFDLLVIPLAFDGDRRAIYERPPATVMLVHDWIWRRRGSSAVVSWLLLKRLNLVIR